MKQIAVIAGLVLAGVIFFNTCQGQSDDEEDDSIELSGNNIDDIRERVKDVDGNVIILESGLRVRVIGTLPDNKWVATYLKAHVLGREVKLVADRQIQTHMEDYESEIPAYVIVNRYQPSVNHSIVLDNPRAFDGSSLGDSLNDIRPSKRVHDNISDLALYMKMRSFLVQTDNGIGTGFFINDAGLALTNHHVLSDMKGKICLYNDSEHDNSNLDAKKVRAVQTIIATDPVLDITVFKVQLNPGEKVDYFDLMDKHVPQGTRVATYGNPAGLTASFTTGDLSAYRDVVGQALVQYSLATNPGNSGGPVVDPAGRVVAVHSIGDKTQQNINYGIDILPVRKLLDKHQLKYGGL